MRPRTEAVREADAARKRDARAIARSRREQAAAAAIPTAIDPIALMRELVETNRRLVAAHERMVAAMADLFGRLSDVFGRPAASVRTSDGVRQPSDAPSALAGAETEIPSSSREASETSKTSPGDLKIAASADASDAPRTSESVRHPSDTTPEDVSERDSSIRIATRPTNAMADGCFGTAVQAWAAGVERVTKKRFQLPRPGAELTKLVDALVAGEPDLAKREAWARAEGEAFARATAGKGKQSIHAFVDWRNSIDKPLVPEGSNPYDGAAIREQRRLRDEAAKKAEREAAPPSPEALALAKGIIPPKAKAV